MLGSFVTVREYAHGDTVSKPYRYARKEIAATLVDMWLRFQNLIGMLGSVLGDVEEFLDDIVSKPYRYARKKVFYAIA